MYDLVHFTEDELECPCCGAFLAKVEFLQRLDLARNHANMPFLITSGYRCKSHNFAVGGSPTSSHLTGYAVDISCQDSAARFQIIEHLIGVGFDRIGIAKDFIHVDSDPDKPVNRIWTY